MKKLITTLTLGLLLLGTNLLAGDEALLKLGVADKDLNTDANSKQTIEVTVTSNHGETEKVVLTETGNDTSRFTATVPVAKSNEQSGDGDGKFNVNQNTEFTVVYNDKKYGNAGEKELSKTLNVAVSDTPDVTPPTDTEGNSASSGGGCTSNPNGKSFDMMFLMMMALGLLYPFRRRFIK